MIKVKISIDEVPSGELEVDSIEEGVEVVENLGKEGQFPRIEGFEKEPEVYEWNATSETFNGGDTVAAKIEIKES